MCRGLLTGGLALRVDLQQWLLLVGADFRRWSGAALLQEVSRRPFNVELAAATLGGSARLIKGAV